MRYRKKPIVIEAFQMTEARRWDNKDWPSWLNDAWNKDPGEGAVFIDEDDPQRAALAIGTKEGVHRVSWGDWIIRGVAGELYPCKPDIFKMTYEPDNEADAARRASGAYPTPEDVALVEGMAETLHAFLAMGGCPYGRDRDRIRASVNEGRSLAVRMRGEGRGDK